MYSIFLTVSCRYRSLFPKTELKQSSSQLQSLCNLDSKIAHTLPSYLLRMSKQVWGTTLMWDNSPPNNDFWQGFPLFLQGILMRYVLQRQRGNTDVIYCGTFLLLMPSLPNFFQRLTKKNEPNHSTAHFSNCWLPNSLSCKLYTMLILFALDLKP